MLVILKKLYLKSIELKTQLLILLRQLLWLIKIKKRQTIKFCLEETNYKILLRRDK